MTIPGVTPRIPPALRQRKAANIATPAGNPLGIPPALKQRLNGLLRKIAFEHSPSQVVTGQAFLALAMLNEEGFSFVGGLTIFDKVTKMLPSSPENRAHIAFARALCSDYDFAWKELKELVQNATEKNMITILRLAQFLINHDDDATKLIAVFSIPPKSFIGHLIHAIINVQTISNSTILTETTDKLRALKGQNPRNDMLIEIVLAGLQGQNLHMSIESISKTNTLKFSIPQGQTLEISYDSKGSIIKLIDFFRKSSHSTDFAERLISAKKFDEGFNLLFYCLECYNSATTPPPAPTTFSPEVRELAELVVNNSPRRPQVTNAKQPDGNRAIVGNYDPFPDEVVEMAYNQALLEGYRILPNRPARINPATGEPIVVAARSRTQRVPPNRNIVVDLDLLYPSNRRPLALTVATLAWRTLNNGGQVTLYLGKDRIALPSEKGTALQKIIEALLNNKYAPIAPATGFIDQLKKLAGSQAKTVAVSAFQENVINRFPQARGFTPVAFQSEADIQIPWPVIILGYQKLGPNRFPNRYRMAESTAQVRADAIVQERINTRARLLEARRGYSVDTANTTEPEIVSRLAQQDSLVRRRPLQTIPVKAQLRGQETIDITSPEPEDLMPMLNELMAYYQNINNFPADRRACLISQLKRDWLEGQYPDLQRDNSPDWLLDHGDFLLAIAFNKGWATVLNYLSEKALDCLFNPDGTRNAPFDEFLDNLWGKTTHHSDFSFDGRDIPFSSWAPSPHYVSFQLLANLLNELAPSIKALRKETPADQTLSTPANSPTASAVDRDESAWEKQPWAHMTGATGRARYLRTALPDLPGVTWESLNEEGTTKISGEILEMPQGDFSLQPAGGSVLHHEGTTLTGTVNAGTLPAEAQETYSLPIDQFRARVGTTVNWQTAIPELLKQHPRVAAEWQELFAMIEDHGLSAREAVVLIKNYVITNFHYHRYPPNSAERLLYQDIVRRFENGKAYEEELFDLILKAKGGTCAEMSRIGLKMLTLFGIPAGTSHGWVVDGNGNVPRMGHAWVEVAIPYGAGKMCGIPVEFSETCSPATVVTEQRVEVEQVQAHCTQIAEERRVEAEQREAAMPGIDRYWRHADFEQRVRIFRAIRSLVHTAINFSGGETPKKRTMREGIVIEELRLFREKKLFAPPNDFEREEVLRLGDDFEPSRFIAQRLLSGKNIDQKLSASRPNINRWYERWASVDEGNAYFPRLEEMFTVAASKTSP